MKRRVSWNSTTSRQTLKHLYVYPHSNPKNFAGECICCIVRVEKNVLFNSSHRTIEVDIRLLNQCDDDMTRYTGCSVRNVSECLNSFCGDDLVPFQLLFAFKHICFCDAWIFHRFYSVVMIYFEHLIAKEDMYSLRQFFLVYAWNWNLLNLHVFDGSNNWLF